MKNEVSYLPHPEQRIRALKRLIDSAQKNIVIQMYLFAANGELQILQPVHGSFPWADTVASWLIAKKKARPDIVIVVLLDTQTIENAAKTTGKKPFLTRHRLEQGGILVLNASLAETKYKPQKKFPTATGFHRVWENKTEAVRLSKSEWASKQHSWQTLQNVEDHRKNIVIDSGKAGIVFSHNIIDQAYHWTENTFVLEGRLAAELWKVALFAVRAALALPVQFSEAEVKLTGWLVAEEKKLSKRTQQPRPHGSTQLLTSGPAILQAIRTAVRNSEVRQNAEILVATTYFSDAVVLADLIQAGKKRRVRILIDSCHALKLPGFLGFFLRQTVNLVCEHTCRKHGGVELRIHRSNPHDMMHCKAIAFTGENPLLIAGQANFTPNSFSGAWLETNLSIPDGKIVRQFTDQFEALWDKAEPVLRYGEMPFFATMRARLQVGVFLPLIALMRWLGFTY